MADWQPIETAPKDGTQFLAHVIDLVDERDEDNRLVAKAVPTPSVVVAQWVEWLTGGPIAVPLHAIYQNRTFTHWMPLPAFPSQG